MSRIPAALRGTLRPVVRRLTGPVGSVRAVAPAGPGPAAAQTTVVLTYDDGPQPGGTEPVLDALAERGATATFFMLVGRARRHPELVSRVLAAGHEVGLHGMDHRRLSTVPVREVGPALTEGKAALEDLTGRPVRWFRPPYGAQTPATWLATRRAGLTPVVWGPAAYDWEERPVDELADRAMAGLAPGSVLLVHDGYAAAADGGEPGQEPTFDRGRLARRILDRLELRGYAGRSLADALAAGRTVSWAWFRR